MKSLIAAIVFVFSVALFVFFAERHIDSMSPEVKAANIAKQEAKIAAAEAEKNAKHLAKLQKNPNWDEEYGDIMWNADGSLKDQTPDNGYTAEQEYGFLIYAIWGVFFMWAGAFTRGNKVLVALWLIIGIIGSVIIYSW